MWANCQRQSTHASKPYTHTCAAVEGLQFASVGPGRRERLLEAPSRDVHKVMTTLEAKECEVDAYPLQHKRVGGSQNVIETLKHKNDQLYLMTTMTSGSTLVPMHNNKQPRGQGVRLQGTTDRTTTRQCTHIVKRADEEQNCTIHVVAILGSCQ
jgi:hypothetical protein